MRLYETIYLSLDCTRSIAPDNASYVCSPSFDTPFFVPDLPLKRVGKTTPIVYACAIAHQVAARSQCDQSQCDAITVAARVINAVLQKAKCLSSFEPVPPLDPLFELSAHVTAAGMIQFEMGERAIAAWLDHLIANTLPLQWLPLTVPLTTVERQSLWISPVMFAVQHAHARCCSLLRLAQRERLIGLEPLDAHPSQWRFTRPASIPWLTATGQLSLKHSADRRLIGELVAAVDQLSDESLPQTPAAIARSAENVAQAFRLYHSVHQLRGDFETDRTAALARFGLLLATQRVLYILLKEGLACDPAIEL